ncbi:MAG: hypothetical protein FGM15_06625 [Chthoniobacterales bacterium]|nr:hypothetical protein [Chthoniobacterales bacterium]
MSRASSSPATHGGAGFLALVAYLLLATGLMAQQQSEPTASPNAEEAKAVAEEIAATSPAVPAPTPEAIPQPASQPSATPTPPPRAADVVFPTPEATPAEGPAIFYGRPAERANYGDMGNRRALQLRSMPPQNFTFDRSSLRDVLRLLAEETGIPYVGIPEHSPKAQRLVTFKMNASPFAALESVARQNDIKLRFEDGVWFMGIGDANLTRARMAEKENELIGVIYQLKHDPVDQVEFRGNASGGGITTQQTGGTGGTSGGTGNISATTPQLPLQYSQRVFEAKAPRIVNEIRVMLGMKPLQYNADGTVVDPDAASGSEVQSMRVPPFDGVGENAPSSSASSSGSAGQQSGGGGALASLLTGVGGGGSAAGQSAAPTASAGSEVPELFPVYVPPQKPQVIYNSDTNILWVVATRKQHKWVGDYLSKVDKPQDLIAIEVKFFETNKNPQSDFGINWEGVFGGDGLSVTGGGSISPSGQISGSNGAVTFNAPYSAVLSVQDATLAIQAFTRDREGSLVQYPRVLTINNREVAITSAENTPVNAGVQNVSSGNVGGQNVGSLSYLPTGTQINILPKAVGKNQIALTVAITISSIIDQVPINLGTGSNQYPVTAERVYNASLQVDSGYTLAVGGLEKSTDLRSTGGIPVLKDIPGVGYLFKNKGRNRSRSNLIIFITPYVISDPSRTPGISENPEAVIPIKPGVPPPAPTFAPDGTLVGGAGALPGAFSWLEYQLKYYRQINKEARDDAKTNAELRGVIQRARALANDLQAQVMEGAGYAPTALLDNSARADALLVELNKVLANAQLDQFQMKEGFP